MATVLATILAVTTRVATVLATILVVTAPEETALGITPEAIVLAIILETPLAGSLANLAPRGTFDSWTTLWI